MLKSKRFLKMHFFSSVHNKAGDVSRKINLNKTAAEQKAVNDQLVIGLIAYTF